MQTRSLRRLRSAVAAGAAILAVAMGITAAQHAPNLAAFDPLGLATDGGNHPDDKPWD